MAEQKPKPTVRELIGDTAPKLLELTEEVLFGDIWERPGLSKRDRSLITEDMGVRPTQLTDMRRGPNLPLTLGRVICLCFH